MSLLELKYTWSELALQVANKLPLKSVEEYHNFLKWFSQREHIGYLFDRLLILRLYRISQELQKDYDHFMVIVGREGSGKTTLMMQCAAWLCPHMTLSSIKYSAETYLDFVNERIKEYETEKENKRIDALILDEGTELSSRENMNLTNRSLQKTFFVQRALNLFVGVCIPDFKALDSTVREHRVRTLLYVTERGRYTGFNKAGIIYLNEEMKKGKKISDIHTPPGTCWKGYFNKDFPRTINVEEYKRQKLASMKSLIGSLKATLDTKGMIPITEAMHDSGYDRSTIIRKIQTGKIDGKRHGGRWFLSKDGHSELIKGGRAQNATFEGCDYTTFQSANGKVKSQ